MRSSRRSKPEERAQRHGLGDDDVRRTRPARAHRANADPPILIDGATRTAAADASITRDARREIDEIHQSRIGLHKVTQDAADKFEFMFG